MFGRKPTMREKEKDRERERKGKRPLKVDTFLSAPDLLARHLLVRRDSAVPDTPTGQGTKAVTTSYPFTSIMHLLDCHPLNVFSYSSDAALQRRCSHTQWSGPLQGDRPEARGCDRSWEPLPFSVS